jgi:hypothetical protein
MTGIIITTADKLACAKRELAMRKNVYPKWVAQNKMSSVTAAHELAAMAAIVRDYEAALMEEAVT